MVDHLTEHFIQEPDSEKLGIPIRSKEIHGGESETKACPRGIKQGVTGRTNPPQQPSAAPALLLRSISNNAEAQTIARFRHRHGFAALAPRHGLPAPPAAPNAAWRRPRRSASSATGVQFDVGSFGAAGDGQTDDTGAFQNARSQACSSAQPAVLLVPAGKSYFVKETSLSGPCKSKVTFKLEGTLQGHPHRVSFSNVDSLTVTGKGKTSWKNSCRRNHKMPCTFAPAALTFSSCNHLKVENIKLLNAPQIHLWVESCSDVMLSRLTIASPGNSPENDGIHVAHSDGVRILGAKIKAGDDCISIAMGTTNLYATKIECGPGHGISVGSLGKGSTRAEVSNVTIDGAQFLNMVMNKVKNPIVIDQDYCTTSDPSKPKACSQKDSAAVEISNVEFSNIRGTSVARDASRLHCSEAFPCRGVVLRDIDLKTRRGGEKNATTSTCENAVLGETSNVSPAPCSSAATKDDLVPLGSEDV
uniref:Pectate lyase superfamily protein domain-containing protein n=1 Tax=Setaria italica TaxID=4555 RepID=K4A1H6_SETIT